MQPDLASSAVSGRCIRTGAVVIAAYALARGVLVSIVTERFRFDHERAVVLREYQEKTARVRSWLMELEGDTARGAARPATSLISSKTFTSTDQASIPLQLGQRSACREGRDARSRSRTDY